MIAPACPIRLPGGAVKPAINAAHGLASEPYNIKNTAINAAHGLASEPYNIKNTAINAAHGLASEPYNITNIDGSDR